MDNKTTFARTPKGEEEIRSRTPHLSGDIKRALLMVDGTASFGDLAKRAAPSLRGVLNELFAELERSGFILDKEKSGSAQAKPASGNIPKMAVPTKMAVPAKKPSEEGLSELDFTAAFRAPSPEVLAAEAAKFEAEQLKKATEEKSRVEAARKEAEAARSKAEQEAAKAREEAEQIKKQAAAAAKAREAAEQQAREAAEAARLKAEQEATKARAELAAAKAKAEAEARAHAEAEAKARKEVEAAKLKAQQEAEAARLKAEQEAAKAREEAEQAKRQAAAVAKAREEAEHRAREAAETARLKAEQETAKVRAELAAAQAKAEAEARAHAEAEAKARQEIEAAKLKAQRETEAARLKAEQETEQAKRKAQQEAEAARTRAEQDAAKAREEAEQAKRQAAAEAKAREEAEHQARAMADAARLKAEQETAKARAELAAAQAEAETRARQEIDAAKLEAQAEAAGGKPDQAAEMAVEAAPVSQEVVRQPPVGESSSKQAAAKRSTSATVLFFDVVGYTKQPVNTQIKIKRQFNQLVSDCLATLEEGERIILDTGDGAAIGFLQHPEDALEVARQFRNAVTANRHKDYPDLEVRTGIHLGPINVVQDMNGQSNMVGDGINDAQRVMSFAGIDQIYISRAYHDFISRLSDEYANLFQYRGLQQDKHGREHAVYELVDPETVEVRAQASESAPAIKLEPFVFAAAEMPTTHAAPEAREESQPKAASPATFADFMDMKVESAPSGETKPQSPPPATSEAKAGKEAPRKETESAKPAVEPRMPTEAEVAAMAAAQAKVWSEAEQRAAKAQEERAAQPSRAPSRPEAPVVRARRKPVPWGKVGAGLFGMMVVALFVVPFVLPMRDYATGVEQLLTTQLKQPVHIGQMSGRILPTPRLELTEVTVGESAPVRVKLARVDFAFSALFGSTKSIDTLALDGVVVNGAALPGLPGWLRQLAADPIYPVARVEFSQGGVETDGLQLSGIAGELEFDEVGKFAAGKLSANDNKYQMDLGAASENRLKVSISVRDSALPLLPGWTFDELKVNGELAENELVITDLDGIIMDGRLLGDAHLSWSSGWRAKGNLVAKAITLEKMGTALSGDMDGSARFLMQSDRLAGLTDAGSLSGTFVVRKGVINGIDIVETARLRSKESLPGGRTHFDELSGELSTENGSLRFRQLRMKAGVLTASGTLDVAKQQLSGQVTANLSMRTGMGAAGLQVGGTSASPSVRTR